jgi:two-component system OmpR family response regulator
MRWRAVRLWQRMRLGDLEIDVVRRRVMRGGNVVNLQPREFRLLEYLMRNAGRMVTRTMLLQNVWEFNFDPKTKVVETHISRLRAKIDQRADKQLVHTVRGSGYVLRESA